MNNTNYLNYKLSLKEYIIYIILFEICCAVIAHYFYDSLYPVIFLNIFVRKYLHIVKDTLQNRRCSKIRMEFLEFISSISSSLNTGYSLENSITEAYPALTALYGNNSIIVNEISVMKNKLMLNIPIELIFEDFGKRTGIEEIIAFSDVIKIAKKGGGDMISIIKTTINTIRDKIELKEEISTIISSRKYEQLIMLVMPFIIFIYIDLTQPDFFLPLYHNLLGIIISTVCLLIYFCSILISNKILEIEV